MRSFLTGLRFLLLAWLVPVSAFARVSIRSAGILGNSGESGGTLVRYVNTESGRPQIFGLGVDQSGYLWAFGGSGAVNQYSADGRLLATFPLSKKGQRGRQMLAVVGDRVVLLGDEKLWSLPTSAPTGTAPTVLPIAAKVMSLSAVDGQLAVISPTGDISILAVATNKEVKRGTLPPNARGNSIVLLPDSSLIIDGAIKLTGEGTSVPIKLPSANCQWVGNSIFCFAGHMTIQRVTADGTPDPGVVYGGSSGSFIGTLAKDGEVGDPAGLVQLGSDRYAAVGLTGAIHRTSGLGVDRQGRVWWNCGYWNWSDGPSDAPHNTTEMTEGEGWQMSFLASDAMTGLGFRNNKPALYYGLIDSPDHNRCDKLDPSVKFPVKLTGSAVLGAAGAEDVVMVDSTGQGISFTAKANGQLKAMGGPVILKLSKPSSTITSLGVTPTGELLAAHGNAVVRLRREGNDFVETARLESWGPAAQDRFGKEIYLCLAGSHLWVSDTANNRVLHFALGAGELPVPAIFPGDPAFGNLDQPQRISASGERAVVVDRGNQRLVKLELTSASR